MSKESFQAIFYYYAEVDEAPASKELTDIWKHCEFKSHGGERCADGFFDIAKNINATQPSEPGSLSKDTKNFGKCSSKRIIARRFPR
jgi:hypothetical protein